MTCNQFIGGFGFSTAVIFGLAKPKSGLLGVTAEGELAHLRVTRRSAVPLFTSAGDITDASRWIGMPKPAVKLAPCVTF